VVRESAPRGGRGGAGKAEQKGGVEDGRGPSIVRTDPPQDLGYRLSFGQRSSCGIVDGNATLSKPMPSASRRRSCTSSAEKVSGLSEVRGSGVEAGAEDSGEARGTGVEAGAEGS
jgi:hypothetical protein